MQHFRSVKPNDGSGTTRVQDTDPWVKRTKPQRHGVTELFVGEFDFLKQVFGLFVVGRDFERLFAIGHGALGQSLR